MDSATSSDAASRDYKPLRETELSLPGELMYEYREISGEDHKRLESPCASLGVKSSVKTPQRSEFGLSLEGEFELAQRREGSLISPPCTWREPGASVPP